MSTGDPDPRLTGPDPVPPDEHEHVQHHEIHGHREDSGPPPSSSSWSVRSRTSGPAPSRSPTSKIDSVVTPAAGLIVVVLLCFGGWSLLLSRQNAQNRDAAAKLSAAFLKAESDRAAMIRRLEHTDATNATEAALVRQRLETAVEHAEEDRAEMLGVLKRLQDTLDARNPIPAPPPPPEPDH